jgi:hypothetical protein
MKAFYTTTTMLGAQFGKIAREIAGEPLPERNDQTGQVIDVAHMSRLNP